MCAFCLHFHRTRDVAELHANMTFNPVKINLQQSQYQCDGGTSVCVNTTVCYRYVVKSHKKDVNPPAGEQRQLYFLLTSM